MTTTTTTGRAEVSRPAVRRASRARCDGEVVRERAPSALARRSSIAMATRSSPSGTRTGCRSSSTSTSSGRGSSSASSRSRRVRRLPLAGRPLLDTSTGRSQTRDAEALRQDARPARAGATAGSRRRSSVNEQLARDGEPRWRADASEPALRAQSRGARAARAEAAAAAPPRGRRSGPVTLGVGEPFTATLKVAGYAALLLVAAAPALPGCTRSSCRRSRRASARSRCR